MKKRLSYHSVISDILNKDRSDAELASLVSGAEQPIDMHKQKEYASKLNVQSWLPIASQVYETSSNIRDYVIAPVILMPSDIPNRNSVAFPMETLLGWNTQKTCPNYKTWVGVPTHQEHSNYDVPKGIVFDTYMVPLKGAHGNIHKVMALCGFCRQKDPDLANAIMQGKRKSYSMGAFVGQYECSVCAAVSKPGKLNTECGHVIRGRPRFHETAHGTLPSYLIARKSILGFEVSSVGTPAWSSATNSQIFDIARY